MASSTPPAYLREPTENDPGSTKVEVPETCKSGVHAAEDFIKAHVDVSKPVRIKIARVIRMKEIREVSRRELEREEEVVFPSQELLEKIEHCRSAEDFLGVIDAMFLEDDKIKAEKKKRGF